MALYVWVQRVYDDYLVGTFATCLHEFVLTPCYRVLKKSGYSRIRAGDNSVVLPALRSRVLKLEDKGRRVAANPYEQCVLLSLTWTGLLFSTKRRPIDQGIVASLSSFFALRVGIYFHEESGYHYNLFDETWASCSIFRLTSATHSSVVHSVVG
jgi:hypothetical protein